MHQRTVGPWRGQHERTVNEQDMAALASSSHNWQLRYVRIERRESSETERYPFTLRRCALGARA